MPLKPELKPKPMLKQDPFLDEPHNSMRGAHTDLLNDLKNPKNVDKDTDLLNALKKI